MKLKGMLIVVIASVSAVVVGAILQGITLTGDFDLAPLAEALYDIGLIATLLSGIALLVLFIVETVRKDNTGK